MSEQYMDEAAEEAVEAQVDEPDAEQEAEQVEEQVDASPDIVARAEKMGWNPDGELGAAEFVERQDSNIAAMRRKVETTEARLADTETRLSEQAEQFEARFQRLQAMGEKHLAKQREMLEAEYDKRMRDAVEMGDMDAFDRAKAERSERLSDLADDDVEVETKKPAGLTISQTRTIEAWRETNPWFGSDSEMTAWATARHGKLLTEKPGLSLDDNLAEVTAAAKELWPDKFGIQRTNGVSRAEGGSRSSGGGKRSISAKLPKEAKAQAARFVEDGTYKSIDEYAKDYFEHYPEDLT